ncbi:hypothetical protein [Halobacterium sp. R2-5]|uniref:hypothetical protein n=1 Tax=Halobacterium sp. R2-5 TaxID=2715751 RepID=UPI0014220929|nr:hypothetical protein [Halobacterium sp. R2-5]NIC00337.1 hypothetical protein [Halobacterium sp. R2-5]
MKRRALLGTLASLALAGCTSSGPGERVTETTRTTTPPTTDATTTEPSATPPEIRDLGVPVDDADCPFDGDGVERVVCYPEQTDVPLSLTPDSDELDLPTDQTTFALENDTEHAFSLNFYDWGLHKRVDGRWYYITPQEIPEPLHTLPAGETHEWTFAVDDSDEPSSGPASESAIDVVGLGGGAYAFETSGWFDSGDHEHRVGLGARFRVKGAPLELTAPEGLSGARDGDSVVVTRDGEDAEPTEAFVVARVGEAGVPFEKQIHQHVAEQLVRPEPGRSRPLLRDALAFFEDGVETVRLEEAGEFDPPFPRDERYYFEYRGAIYEAAVESVE